MRAKPQSLDVIVDNLSVLDVDWMDGTAASVIAKLAALAVKDAYDVGDVRALVEDDFEEGILCCRLFLGLSKDQMEARLKAGFEGGPAGVMRYRADPEAYLALLDELGVVDAMTNSVNRKLSWSDVLVERLRSGRGSAISGQKRGRGLEDVAAAMVREVFGAAFEERVTFTGEDGKTAKCDIAIPNREDPRILIESKAYGATGSKMTDIIGDLDAIIEAKRSDTALLFVTDGITWKARRSDLAKIVARQNQGRITRIYTSQMRDEFLADLRTLRDENGL